jgi:hypothetical protein
MSNRVSNGAVFALALILIVGGAWGIWRGADYIQLERGWASVISGSVAFTGGVLTLAVGFVLRRLDALHGALLAVAAGKSEIALPVELPAATPQTEPMPLSLAPTPTAHAPEPQLATYADPALQAAAAINVELLEREERPAAGERHPLPSQAPEPTSSEAPPEVIHAAHQGPADDMVQAAGVGDEPELDAAIEELLADERGRGSQQEGGAGQVRSWVSAEAASTETRAPALAAPAEVPDKPPQRTGWRGLFSRRERRAAAPAVEHPAAEPLLPDVPDPTGVAPEGEARPEHVPTEEPVPVQSDTIPRTGDDWFDRALSGIDEAEMPYQSAGEAPGSTRQRMEPIEETESRPELHSPSLQEPPGAPPPAEPAVIGRYTSGNTTYIMFADGSIEAETPTGILRFASLADLKSYVEGGQ